MLRRASVSSRSSAAAISSTLPVTPGSRDPEGSSHDRRRLEDDHEVGPVHDRVGAAPDDSGRHRLDGHADSLADPSPPRPRGRPTVGP